MASTYTSNIRLEKQGDGENPNTWGTRLNANTIGLIDEAITGYTTVDVSSVNVSLTANSGSSDQARSMAIELKGTVSVNLNVTIPSKSKFYIINDKTTRQNSAAITMKTASGSGLAVPIGAIGGIFCDGVSVFNGNGAGIGVGTAADLDHGTGDANLIPVSLADVRYVPTSTNSSIVSNKTFTKNVIAATVTLTDAASINIDNNNGVNFLVSLGGNRTLGNIGNAVAGTVGHIYVVQDGTGSRTLAYGDGWKFPNNTAPTMSTSINSVDMIAYSVRGISVYDGIHVTAFG